MRSPTARNPPSFSSWVCGSILRPYATASRSAPRIRGRSVSKAAPALAERCHVHHPEIVLSRHERYGMAILYGCSRRAGKGGRADRHPSIDQAAHADRMTMTRQLDGWSCRNYEDPVMPSPA
jgi:hypothetical protein